MRKFISLVVSITILGAWIGYVAAVEVENLVLNPDFERSLAEWQLEVHGDFVNATMEQDKEGVGDKRSVRIDIHDRQPGAESWRLQFKQVSHKVEQGQRYTWTLWAKSEAKLRSVHLWVGMETDPWEALGGEKDILITDEWKEYQLTFTATQDFKNTRLSVQLGDSDAVVWIDHVRFYEGDYVPDEDIDMEPQEPEPQQKKGDNLAINPEFQQGTAGWSLEVHADFVKALIVPDNIPAIGDNKSIRIDIEEVQPGSEAWRLQFKQTQHQVRAGKMYTLSFWAKAADFRPMDVWVGMESDPWDVLGLSENVDLMEPEWKEYYFTFVASQDFDNTRLAIQLGTSPVIVWVDHVRFYEGEYDEEDFGEIMKQRPVSPAGKQGAAWGRIKSP